MTQSEVEDFVLASQRGDLLGVLLAHGFTITAAALLDLALEAAPQQPVTKYTVGRPGAPRVADYVLDEAAQAELIAFRIGRARAVYGSLPDGYRNPALEALFRSALWLQRTRPWLQEQLERMRRSAQVEAAVSALEDLVSQLRPRRPSS